MAGNYTVQPGDCITSLAGARGLLWETIWNHPSNANLKTKRQDPNILFPGDVVYIPDIELRYENRPTDQQHQFVKKGVPAKIRIRIMKAPEPSQVPAARGSASESGARHITEEDPEQTNTESEIPRANTPYILNIDGKSSEGTTDGDGYVEVKIPPGARRGTLTLDPGTLGETVIPLQIGHLDPLAEITGVKQRLANLGFDCGDSSNKMNDNLGAALRAFQETQGLPPTGELNDEIRNALKTAHGS